MKANKPSPVWNVVTLKRYTGDILDYVKTYSNRGHALAALKGLENRAFKENKQTRYALRKG